ncbi:phosphate/phosphite/phosphonate ABC transporter substrate-binding protein [Enterovibrio sp. 27052020O]|uniref:phosphate/phosphite/phosphonate ABC transporter substrate-binding protein n=1 Tax=Enterovibrio sp. 27052020O TaxID=3241166 RepID=UPI00388D2EFA
MRSVSKRQLASITLWHIALLIASIIWLATALSAQAATKLDGSEPLVFGIVPQQSSAKLIRDWSPVIKQVSELSGLQIRFATAPNIPEFEKRLAAGQYHLAYMNPYHFTVFNQSPGYQAIAHVKDKRIRGILVTSKHSNTTSLKDLDGKNVAFPAPAAFAATLLTQAALKNEGVTFKPYYVGSHDSAYLAVADGLFDAGGGIIRTLGATPENTKKKLNVLFTTEGFTPHAVATHPSLSDDTKKRLQAAFVALADNPEGKAALKTLNMKGFQSATDADWDDVRALNISVINPD